MDPAFNSSSFTKNKQRLLKHQVAHEIFFAVIVEARLLNLLSGDHFSVDGILLEAWASIKVFSPKVVVIPQETEERILRLISMVSGITMRLTNQLTILKFFWIRKARKRKKLYDLLGMFL